MAPSSLSVSDRGLAYGDGVFETIAVVDHQPVLLEPHLLRLFRGLKVLQFDRTPDQGALHDEIEQQAQAITRGVMKVVVTRGEGGRGYAPPVSCEPSVLISQHDWPTYPVNCWQNGIDTILCETRLAQQPILAGIKHLNRLEQVLASQECAQANYLEGLLKDTEDNVICGTKTNVFVVKGKSVLTPKLDQCGIQGVMRDYVTALAKKVNLTVSEQMLTLDHLKQADEVFVTNSLVGIWPIQSIQPQHDGESIKMPVGPTTRALQYLLQQRLQLMPI